MDHRRIKYYACGEYGSNTLRPHYHAIIFGLSLSADDRQLVMDSWRYCDWNNSTIRDKSFGSVNDQSIGYVTGYVSDKLSDQQENIIYDQTGRERPFHVSSLGLGKQFVLEYSDELNQDLGIKKKGKIVSMPRYYRKLLDITIQNNDEYAKQCYAHECNEVAGIVKYHTTEKELYNSDYKFSYYFQRKFERQRQREKNIKSKIAILKKRSL